MSHYHFKRENVKDFWHIIEPLTELHWKETGLLDIPLNIDKELYEKMDLFGWHLGYSICYDNEIIGYVSIIKITSPANKDAKIAMTDGFFIKKEFRTTRSFFILKHLFKQAELDLKQELGIEYLILTTHGDNPLFKLAEKFGFSKASYQFIKRI